MLTCEQAQEVADMLAYKDWKGNVATRGTMCAFWWSWRAPCVHSGVMTDWTSREWLLSFPITDETVVRTAFAAAKMAEEHECAENFLFAGRRVFDPHRSVL